MDISKITSGETKKMAELTAIELNIPKGELDVEFAKYWDQVKDILGPDLVKAATKGGFRQVTRNRAVKAAGGAAEFFKPVLADVVTAYLDAQPQQALALTAVSMLETPSQYVVRSTVYLEPKVTWKKEVPGVDQPLVVKLPKEPEGLLERSVQEELEMYQDKSAVLVPTPEGTKLVEGHMLALYCESLIDGKRWEPGCFENNKWLMDRQLFRIPGMFEQLEGVGVGETKKFDALLNEKFESKLVGKTAQITLRVHQIYTKQKPAIDDDLAKTFGSTDLVAFKAAITTKVQRELEEGKQRLLSVSAASKLMDPELVEVEPVPYAWMVAKARELYGEGRKSVRTEEELIRAFVGQTLTSGEPVTDKETLLTFLAEKSAQSLVLDLVLRAWGRKKGLGDTKPDMYNLSMMHDFVTMVKETILLGTQIEYYEVAKPEVINAPV